MTDDILEALAAGPGRDKRTRCYFAEWFKTLSPERQEAFSRAMSPASRWKATDLYALAVKAGYEKRYNTLLVHRSGRCSCEGEEAR